MMALRSHLFPYRTQKLSSIAPKVVGGSLPARIGRRDTTWNHTHSGVVFCAFKNIGDFRQSTWSGCTFGFEARLKKGPLRLTVAVIKLKINVIGWLSKSEDDRNVILIFNNSESTVFHLNVDTMQVIAEALITIVVRSISLSLQFLRLITIKCELTKLLFNYI